jgi:hypothetical protein
MFRNGQRLNAVIRIKREGMKKPVFPRVGVAFVNVSKNDRPYISIKLDAIPTGGGALELYPNEPKTDESAEERIEE